MMAEKEMRNQFRSAITAAAVCCRMPVSDETSSITQYLKSLLDAALDGAGLYADVIPLPYQPCSKLPVVIALDGKNPRRYPLLPQAFNLSHNCMVIRTMIIFNPIFPLGIA